MAGGGRTTEAAGGTRPIAFTSSCSAPDRSARPRWLSALLGRCAGETGATMGTTSHGRSHTHAVEGVEGTLLLTDTPSLGEAGEGGSAREAEAVDLALRADLLVFVVDHDMARADHRMVGEMAREGKRLIVALNKKDRLTEEDRDAILAKLRERLGGLVPAEDVVAVAADPSPVTVRIRKPDGTTETTLEEEPPDLEALEARVAAILAREGDDPPRRQPSAPRPPARAGRARPHRRGPPQAGHGDHRASPVAGRRDGVRQPRAGARARWPRGRCSSGCSARSPPSTMSSSRRSTSNRSGGRWSRRSSSWGSPRPPPACWAACSSSIPLGFMAGGVVQAVTMAYLTRLTGAIVPGIRRTGPDLGRRRDAGRPDTSPRGHPPLGVAGAVRKSGPPSPPQEIGGTPQVDMLAAIGSRGPWRSV